MLTIFKNRSLVKVGQDTLRLLWVICANILHLLNSVTKKKEKSKHLIYMSNQIHLLQLYTRFYIYFLIKDTLYVTK